MKYYFLDGGGAFLYFAAMILFMVLTIVIEGVIMLLFKIDKAGKVFLYSLVVNLASLGAGYLVAPLIRPAGTLGPFTVLQWGIMFAVTVVVEGHLLLLLTKKKPREKVWLAVIVMNLVSYLLLFAFFRSFRYGF